MNRAAIEELYTFLDFAWRQIVGIASAAGDEVVASPASGSGWPTLRDCLAHIVFGYDRWMSILLARPMAGLADGLRTLADIDAARTGARREVTDFLGGLSDERLHEVRDIVVDGEPVPYSYAELLAHLALHERGHHGDVTTLFYQLGIGEETALEYRFHLGRTGLH